ncbi:MAG TPA: hypothetical protein VKX96_02445 [Chloroflexota bacterium]|nr:hypothetical protein [Chloroflexota bacterium]
MSESARQARIVFLAVGPIERLQLRELVTDSVVWSTGISSDPGRDEARVRREAEQMGYEVVGKVAIER